MNIIKQRERLPFPQKVAIIGNFEVSDFPIEVSEFLDFFRAKSDVVWAKGYGTGAYIDEALLNEAQRKAQAADLAILLLYLPADNEKIPINQHQLIRSVSLVQDKLIALVYAEKALVAAWKKYTYMSIQIDQGAELYKIMEQVMREQKD
ncbi:MAG: hypothetical protein AAGI49_10570 [Bacteroidota bacterium]